MRCMRSRLAGECRGTGVESDDGVGGRFHTGNDVIGVRSLGSLACAIDLCEALLLLAFKLEDMKKISVTQMTAIEEATAAPGSPKRSAGIF